MNENREVIIPGVLGVLSFIAKAINSVPNSNDMVKGMAAINRAYPIAQGRIYGIPLSDLIKDTEENTLRKPGRFYDELGL